MADPKPKFDTLKIILLLLSARLIWGAEENSTIQENIVGYEAPCNATSPCAPNKGLNCSVDGLCKCSYPDRMVYDKVEGSCVVAFNNPCMSNGSKNDTGESSLLPCPRDLKCDPETAFCFPIQPPLNQNCLTSDNCQQKSLGFTCENNLCTCGDPNNTYTTPERCLGKVEKPCVNDKCAPNAVCMVLLAANDSEHANICKCIEGYYPTPAGSCAKDYGIVCTQRPCQPWLKCGPNGTCECQDPETQVFDVYRESCVTKINGLCNSNFTDKDDHDPAHQITCVDGGHCVKNTYFVGGKQANISLSHCECKPGFAENDQGTCDLVHGRSCSDRDFDDGNHQNLKCNRELKLACIKGKCICEEHFNAFDEEEGKCVGLSGAACTTDADLWDGDFKTPYNQYNLTKDGGQAKGSSGGTLRMMRGGCTKGARCQPVGAGTKNSTVGIRTGICKCVGDNLQFDGSCEAKPLVTAQWIIIFAAAGTGLIVGLVLLSCCSHIKKQGQVISNWLL